METDAISFFIVKQLSEFIHETISCFDKIKVLIKSDDFYNQCLIQIQHKVLDYINPVLKFEFEVYKKAFKVEGGSYSDFCREITNDKEWILYFWESYPVLSDILFKFVDNFKCNFKQIIDRLNNDIHYIEKSFEYNVILNVKKIHFFLGDFHKNGQNTVAIHIINGYKEECLFFYKPRSLSPDILWNDIVTYLQKIGLPKSVELTNNIDKTEYGWQKGVNFVQFNSPKALKDFYFNQGINSALAYLFNIQDLIADNVTIKDDFPVFFDLEMSFCPQNPLGNDYRTKSKSASNFLLSVIKTGLIPSYGFETANHIGYSNSGVSLVKGGTNLPVYESEVVSINNYCIAFEEGFENACLFFINNKNRILSYLKGLIDRFKNMQVRTLIRLTFTYSELIRESKSPLYLSNYYDYIKLIELLWRGYERNVLPAIVIQEEINQILDGDIPLFTSKPLSKHLYDHAGNVIVTDYFQESGYESIMQKINNINAAITQEQINIIRRAFYIHNESELSVEYKFVSHRKKKGKDATRFLIDDIASFIYRLDPYSDDNYFSYSDYVISKEDMWTQGLQSCDMFQGIEGIGVFFTAYSLLTNDSKALKTASTIFGQSTEFLHANKYSLLDNNKVKIGVVNFPVSTIYYHLLGNKILNKRHFHFDKDTLCLLFDYIDNKCCFDQSYCYFSGATGSLLILMEFYNTYPSSRLFNLIKKLGDHLISSSFSINSDMISWRKDVFDKWGGFAHGNSSASYALFKLADFLKDNRVYEYAIKALQYDQSLFNFNEKKWDKSDDFEGDIHHSWGNGSAGIGLSRHLISHYYKNDFMAFEIETAIENMNGAIKNMITQDHSVCSGVLGMLEVHSILNPRFDYGHSVRTIFDNIAISELKCGGWEKNPLVTGLYYGFAGIGYNLIKAYIKNIPSLLWI